MSTFSQQNSLPSLPLPGLEETIDKYLKSLIPIVSQAELLEVTNLCQEFADSSDALKLQNFLETKSESSKNWVENWWYDAYTTNRESLLTQNMGAIIPKSCGNFGQIEIASQIIHYMMKYWKMVRKEQIEVTKSRGLFWDMSQVYNLFNACRVPEIPKDEIKRYFCTEAEGSCPSHVIILCNGHIWKLDPVLANGEILSILEMQKILRSIKEKSGRIENESVVKLTTMERDKWAEIKEAISSNSDENAKNFEIIESAVFCLTLSDDLVENDSQLMKYSIFGSPLNTYSDKNLNIIVLRDGKSCLQAEHANVDAISLFAPCDFAADHFQDLKEVSSQHVTHEPVKIEFRLSASLTDKIREAEKGFSDLISNINVNVYHYSNFGAKFCKSRKLYADTIIQIALQMAFLKTHGRMAPTYETASTRKFYHGRTETVRSLTLDMARYLTACENGTTNETLRTMFFDAYNSHNTLMDAAREGRGIDRHFLGLRKAQKALNTMGENIEIPFLDHPSFSKSGGNGNFLLSTSFLGYNEQGCFGYVVPMCKDGYGTFYRINSDSFSFTISNFLDDASNSDEFRENLEFSLDFIKNVMILTDESL